MDFGDDDDDFVLGNGGDDDEGGLLPMEDEDAEGYNYDQGDGAGDFGVDGDQGMYDQGHQGYDQAYDGSGDVAYDDGTGHGSQGEHPGAASSSSSMYAANNNNNPDVQGVDPNHAPAPNQAIPPQHQQQQRMGGKTPQALEQTQAQVQAEAQAGFIDLAGHHETSQQQQHQEQQQEQAKQDQEKRQARIQRYTSTQTAQPKAPPQEDPNEQKIADMSKDVIRLYNELETTAGSLLKASLSSASQSGNALESGEGACYTKLLELNAACDKLRRLAQRKLDILAVEDVLLRRNEQEHQENPQDVVKTKAESLCVSRSGFQKVVYPC
ncbi:Hypothetical Protein FCC1311_058262 [Hondaea fermentalgiana]|uniref:Uncharacterized protein n=1 Tax=Hondaea fermentalgiana TaxID=2315210 RepID=A0A2R5GG80_9STRA|nr:Hypothetical Protein FCC1311_058262 [Hondaea fermentalgiana]|eukprot:GBG29605.1 Hypothetical Protein FCC1311_058262 [Hondaea fermentalgiana]